MTIASLAVDCIRIPLPVVRSDSADSRVHEFWLGPDVVQAL
jgi:hypothetical protein